MAQHAHRHDLCVEGGTHHAGAVVGDLATCRAEHMRAVPAAGLGGLTRAALVRGGPVAGVPAAGYATVGGTARHGRATDEVVAGIGEREIQIRMIGHAGIETGDGHAGAVSERPCLLDIGGAPVGDVGVERVVEEARAAGRQVIPLIARVVLIVGNRESGRALRTNAVDTLEHVLRFHEGHRGVGRDLLDQRRRLGRRQRAIGVHQIRTGGQPALVSHRKRTRRGERSRTQFRARHRHAHVLHRHGSVAALAAAVLVRDDETAIALIALQWTDIEIGRRRRRRAELGGGRRGGQCHQQGNH